MTQDRVHAFVKENMKTIYAYALSRVSHKQDAEELAGDIIVAILNSAERLRNDDALFGYVWKIAANTYKKYLRNKKCIAVVRFDELVLEELSDPQDFTQEIFKSEQLNSLRRELSILSREYRECTVAYYFDGLSCLETAKKLNISLEMVKYYLFKTRKLLKEGIGMEREFGEKSYKPSYFELLTIFSGEDNQEYRNLFHRKLPGNILLSAYYTPMTIRELSIELGVSSAYMEDEVALLEKYHLLTRLAGGKYQTNLVIFTENYTREFDRIAADNCTVKIGEILTKTAEAFPQIRAIGFSGCTLPDNRLLWPFLWLIMHRGHSLYQNSQDGMETDPIYDGATGINYGADYKETDTLNIFAGYARIDDQYAAAFADFDILPVKNRYSNNSGVVVNSLYTHDGAFVVFTKEELENTESVLSTQIEAMACLYSELAEKAEKLMRVHASKGVETCIEKIIKKTIFFRTVGLIGKCAVHSGELLLPDDENPIAVFVYQMKESDQTSANHKLVTI